MLCDLTFSVKAVQRLFIYCFIKGLNEDYTRREKNCFSEMWQNVKFPSLTKLPRIIVPPHHEYFLHRTRHLARLG